MVGSRRRSRGRYGACADAEAIKHWNRKRMLMAMARQGARLDCVCWVNLCGSAPRACRKSPVLLGHATFSAIATPRCVATPISAPMCTGGPGIEACTYARCIWLHVCAGCAHLYWRAMISCSATGCLPASAAPDSPAVHPSIIRCSPNSFNQSAINASDFSSQCDAKCPTGGRHRQRLATLAVTPSPPPAPPAPSPLPLSVPRVTCFGTWPPISSHARASRSTRKTTSSSPTPPRSRASRAMARSCGARTPSRRTRTISRSRLDAQPHDVRAWHGARRCRRRRRGALARRVAWLGLHRLGQLLHDGALVTSAAAGTRPTHRARRAPAGVALRAQRLACAATAPWASRRSPTAPSSCAAATCSRSAGALASRGGAHDPTGDYANEAWGSVATDDGHCIFSSNLGWIRKFRVRDGVQVEVDVQPLSPKLRAHDSVEAAATRPDHSQRQSSTPTAMSCQRRTGVSTPRPRAIRWRRCAFCSARRA